MNFRYKINLIRFVLLIVVLTGFVSFVSANPYIIWGAVHNSDSSTPTTGDITITVYLQKNPSNTYVLYNTNNGFNFDLDYAFGYFQHGDGGPTNANPGDNLVLDFENTNSESPFFGETGQIIDAVGTVTETPQQFGTNDFSLPVEISSFQAKFKENKVVLVWVTQSELDNLGFNIFKSVAGKTDFYQLNSILIDGAGTSTSSHTYKFIDDEIIEGNTYYYRLESVDVTGQKHIYQPLSVSVELNNSPETHELFQNYPNPFNPATQIRYRLSKDSHVCLTVYNAIGDLVAQLANEQQSTGSYSYMWDGTDGYGRPVAAGLYFYKLDTNQATQVRKMIFAK